MRPFALARPTSPEAAVLLAAEVSGPRGSAPEYLGGGTTLIDLMKLDVLHPATVIDITSLEGDALRTVELGPEGLQLGALATMAEVADDRDVRLNYPVVAEALEQAASAQLRNMARLGGNLLQRTRCPYFRDTSWPCNKREPGSGCSAMGGVNRLHAVLGTSDDCIASYPGDFAPALVALDATIETVGPLGRRTLPVGDVHREPGTTPHVETNIEPGELILAIRIPAAPVTQRSAYIKVRDRESYAFALASAAVALDLAPNGEVRDVRIALGGLATRPWRARDAEDELVGKPLTDEAMAMAADAALSTAISHGENDFKIELGKQTIVRALRHVRDMKI